MSLLYVNGIQKHFGPDMVIDGIGFKLEWGQKLGLIGRNGAGKTTLLRILTGQMEPDRGTVQYDRGIRSGYLKQEDAVDPTSTVMKEAETAFAPVLAMENRMRELELAMAAAQEAELPPILEEYNLYQDRFDAMGGYSNLRDIPAVLKRLGFSQEDFHKPCGKLSGGEKTRLALARLLLSGVDVLFLDEPTNHLDIEATEWLEGFIKDFGGAVVLVSHDRYFLDRVVTSVAEIENTKMTLYKGNFSAFQQQKQSNIKRQQEIFEREQREIARLEAFFEKWKNTPSRKNQAVMRHRWAERIRSKATEKPDAPGKNAKLGVKAAQTSGNEVVILDNVGKRYGTRTLFEGVRGLIRRGERVGFVGPNGAGKSTLIKLLMNREPPTSGMARLGANVTVGYFAQDTSDLDLEANVLENLLNAGEMDWVQARTHLGRFLFTGDDVFKEARLLSGGEKNKLVLAQLTFLRPNLLILDEPTNHLDLASRESLAEMLKNYDGTLLLISHDRYLLDIVTNRTVEVANGVVTWYDGNYTAFREARAAGKLMTTSVRPVATDAPLSATESLLQTLLAEKPERVVPPAMQGMNAYQRSKERQRAKAAAADAERRVGEVEAKLGSIEAKLSNPSPADNVVALSQEHGGVQLALAEAMEAWERAAAYYEEVEQAFTGG